MEQQRARRATKSEKLPLQNLDGCPTKTANKSMVINTQQQKLKLTSKEMNYSLKGILFNMGFGHSQKIKYKNSPAAM